MAQKGPLALRLWNFKKAFIEDDTPVDDLSFLSRHRDTLRELVITGDEEMDVAEINQLRALERLNINAPGGANAVLRLAGMPSLRQLSILDRGPEGRRLIVDFGGATEIRQVLLAAPDESEVAAVAALPRLADATLEGAGAFPARFASLELTDLTVTGVTSWPASVTGIERVVSLEVAESRGLADLSLFADASPLRFLTLFDLPGLRSLRGVRFADDAEIDIQGCPDLVDLGELDPGRAVGGAVTGSPRLGLP
ncbi:hypothetical protein [Tessaracoccus flavus]|uniref:Uncharacterized protein n=1 Tax=Tessaracoccus flavus TaxID=1610493 RepID=A0A1Q2CC89_9ACTN|nr:hypothetical protein [Tessaracoccus flavus]AQP43710.1 hypothetical protein RPIT_01880 [Tessaracoccus flavus]SDZ03321.1 hypothetical protein SAMN05428934_108124 [Tessaracoccus flavus]